MKHLINRLPIHFFTMVLDGMPFLRWHIDQLQKIQSPWQWHIVEGLADLKHEIAWSVTNGGRLPRGRGQASLSRDGNTKYFDALQRWFPSRVKIYGKPSGQLWEGKVAMALMPTFRSNRASLISSEKPSVENKKIAYLSSVLGRRHEVARLWRQVPSSRMGEQ